LDKTGGVMCKSVDNVKLIVEIDEVIAWIEDTSMKMENFLRDLHVMRRRIRSIKEELEHRIAIEENHG
jgi:hypothetical protein